VLKFEGEGLEAYEKAFAGIAATRPAFPIALVIGKPGEENVQLSAGITKREYVAAMAMQGLIRFAQDGELGPKEIASDAIQYADALIAQLAVKAGIEK
jgi:hypothetical protein